MASSQVAPSILSYVSTGAYPESEDVVSTELSSSTLPLVIDILNDAKEDLENDISTQWQDSGEGQVDLNTWISQAETLQAAIADSKATANSIIAESQASQTLLATVQDAAAKISLLEREVAFNEALADALETLQVASGQLDVAAEKVSDGDIRGGLDGVIKAEKVLKSLSDLNGARGVELLARRAGNLRERVIGDVKLCWDNLVHVDSQHKIITIRTENGGAPLDLVDVAESMDTLGILSQSLSKLHREFDSLIISPRVLPGEDGSVARVDVSNNSIETSGRHKDTNAVDMIRDIRKIVDFLENALPEPISNALINKVLPSLMLQLVSGWLDPSMPLKLDQLDTFKNITDEVAQLSDAIAKWKVDMPSDADLNRWLKRIPQNWLARRKEAALADMRTRCYNGVKVKKSAEKIETQVIDSDDIMYGGQEATATNGQSTEQGDDWGENWGENEDEGGNSNHLTHADQAEEDDTSAWDVDEADETQQKPQDKDDDGDDAEADAWDEWGDEQEQTEDIQTSTKTAPKSPTTTRIARAPKSPTKTKTSKKEITLREVYTVTSIPDAILDILSQILDDASTLTSPSFDFPTISTAAPALSTIPTLLLALYRATAFTFYSSDPAGQMLIYNDTQYFATRLHDFVASISAGNPLASRIRLDADIEQLTQFGRRAYGREMDSQRTILSDILSSASGFVNCTAPLNAKQYAAIVQDAINRIRDVERVWNGVLSDSARLQSLGSLVGTVTKQMVSDILERADDTVGISEEQSKILKSYCDKIAALADLFTEPGSDGEQKSLIHVYTPDWLRFIYLGEILEASLADIRYLWTEGELALEFEANEIVDLIQALFADSSHRKEAIREIRRSM